MRDVEDCSTEQFCLTIPHELAHRGVGTEETAGFRLDLDLAYAADIEHGAECLFAPAQSGFIFLPLGKIVEMAHDAETAVRHGHALDLPIVGFDCIGVFSLLDTGGRVVRLTGVERVAEVANRIAGERLGPPHPPPPPPG